MSDYSWWHHGTVYQIYPRSFMDSNNDGIGDMRGIINKLDYLQWLGIDAIWLSPHYPSPQVDVGYDISDYVSVNPEYGSLDDFREFLSKAHARDIRVIIDFVLNHTSDQHQWFLESKSSKDNPKRDWYVWRDGDGDNPPNNWESTFGGSAWEYDETTGQYYYHYFLKEQPDLNWRNPEVKQAMFDAMRFWFDMGVDGLRLDAIGTIYEDPEMPDHTSKYNAVDIMQYYWMSKQLDDDIHDITLFEYQSDLPEIFDLMQELRQLADEYDDKRYLVGETDNFQFLGHGTDQLHSIFNFDLLRVRNLTPEIIRNSQAKWFTNAPEGAWQSNTLDNHDQARALSNFADGKNDVAIAKVAGAAMFTLKGTPYIYYGEEIGMQDYAVKSFDEVRDMVSDVYRKLASAEGRSDEEILADLATFSRDKCRTPMQWDNSANAGFSEAGVKTWLPVHDCYRDGVNVADQEDDTNSILNVYRSLIHLRKTTPALRIGDYQVIDGNQNHYLGFLRITDNQTCLVLLSLSENIETVHYATDVKDILYSSTGRAEVDNTSRLQLAPYEILILSV